MTAKQTILVDLTIDGEELKRLYRGVCNTVLARARDGRWVRFPAAALRAHVIGHGVYGRFVLHVADCRLTAMERFRCTNVRLLNVSQRVARVWRDSQPDLDQKLGTLARRLASCLRHAMYRTLRNLLFLLPPEMSHDIALTALQIAARGGLSQRFVHGIYQPVAVMGLKFRNGVGLAAGLDKDARCIEGLLAMGFGFIEVGTVTPRAQPGNPRPRLFRLPDEGALINRMGFNNDGAFAAAERVRRARQRLGPTAGLIGINIGKNKDTTLDDAAADYLEGLDAVYDVADYVTVNVSSPNTAGLRELQKSGALRELLTTLKTRQTELTAQRGRYVPLAAKLAPDLDDAEIEAVASVLLDVGIDGCIATNTTVSRPLPPAARYRDESGGLSGVPLNELAVSCVARLARAFDGRIPIIGVGGIHDVASARRFMDAGASLVQLYTGFIFEGPALVRDLARSLRG